jgi:CHAD domain-containing protein
METHLEREVKLAAEEGFQIPPLAGDEIAPRRFTSTYHDTADLRLAATGITLRRRVEGRRAAWQLKLPHGDDRLELAAPGPSGVVPAELAELVRGVSGGRTIGPIAVLRSERRGVLAREGGRALAVVVVDSVEVLRGRTVVRRFGEIEIELVDGDGDDLARLERALREAGARTGDGRPKVFRALDLHPHSEPAVVRDAPAIAQLDASVRAQRRELLLRDPGTRLGRDPEELHQFRVASRRLRAYLRAARDLLDPAWAEPLRVELGWLGSAVGPVRDLDVLGDRLAEDLASLPEADCAAGEALLDALRARREQARATMLTALDSARYLRLLETLDESVHRGSGPAQRTLVQLARQEFRRLRRTMGALGDDSADAELHAARIRVKRARYAGELAQTAAGRRGEEFVRAAKGVQDVLGEHQDSAVAEHVLRELAASGRFDGTTALVAGRLVDREQVRRADARRTWPGAWERLERAGRRSWR